MSLSTLVTAIGLAGCSSASSPADAYPDLSIADLQTRTTSAGSVIVTVSVHNDGSAPGEARLICEVDIQGGGRFTDERSITVDPNQTTEYRFEFQVTVADGTRYTYDARLE